MYIERDFFRARRPILVTETVEVFAVIFGVEGVVARGDSGLVDKIVVGWVHDLDHRG